VSRHDLIANRVHAVKGSDVSHVLVDGRLDHRAGEIGTLEEATTL